MKKERFSVSRVNLYLENPFKHYCKYVEGLKAITTPEDTKYMDRGTFLHKFMELLTQGTHYTDALTQAHMFGEEKGYSEEALTTGFIACERYLEEHKDDMLENIIHTEYEIIYPISDTAEYIGYIDAIMQHDDGSVTLVDYKTYSNSPQEDKHKYGLQANIYMYVADKLGFNVRGFMFDCVNPKEVLKGRAYKTKRIEFSYNKFKCEQYWEDFCETVVIMQQNPEYSLYKPTENMPDVYDYFHKVLVGDISEDVDEFIEKKFKKSSKKC